MADNISKTWDLNDNQVPSDMTLVNNLGGGAVITRGYLHCPTNDDRGYLTLTDDFATANKESVRIKAKGKLFDATWATAIYLRMVNSTGSTIVNLSYYDSSSGGVQRELKLSWYKGTGTTTTSKSLSVSPFTARLWYPMEVTVDKDGVTAKFYNSSGSLQHTLTITKAEIEANSSYRLSDIANVQYWVYRAEIDPGLDDLELDVTYKEGPYLQDCSETINWVAEQEKKTSKYFSELVSWLDEKKKFVKKMLSESLSWLSNFLRGSRHKKILTEIVTWTDELCVKFGKIISETINWGETKILRISKTILERVNWLDSFYRRINRKLIEFVDWIDEALRHSIFRCLFSEEITWTDKKKLLKRMFKVVIEPVAWTEKLLVKQAKAFFEVIGWTDKSKAFLNGLRVGIWEKVKKSLGTWKKTPKN